MTFATGAFGALAGMFCCMGLATVTMTIQRTAPGQRDWDRLQLFLIALLSIIWAPVGALMALSLENDHNVPLGLAGGMTLMVVVDLIIVIYLWRTKIRIL